MNVHKLLCLAALLFATAQSHAQVIISEFTCANLDTWNLGTEFNAVYHDYVELYNPGNAVQNISGYWLSDDADNPMKWQFPTPTELGPGAREVVLLTGRGDFDPDYLGYLNTNFHVTQTEGEEIVFSDAGGNVLEQYDFDLYPVLSENHVWCRMPDGSNNWRITDVPTPGAENAGNVYTDYTAPAQCSHVAGYYDAPIEVYFTTENVDEAIYYTTDGTTPDATDLLYTGAIALDTTTVLRAIAMSPDPLLASSKVLTRTFFFGDDVHTLYTVSVAGDEVGNGVWGGSLVSNEKTTIEIFAPNGNFIAKANGLTNEHGNDGNAYNQRGFDFVCKDARGYEDELHYQVFHQTPRPSFERVIFRPAGQDNYPFGDGAHVRDAFIHELSTLASLNLDERTPEACIVYLNGVYWGVYYMHEKVDDLDYTKYYYQQPRGHVDLLKRWGGTWTEYGDMDDWTDLVDFVLANDLSDVSNYDYVTEQLELGSIADYFILNTYIVNSEWLNWDTMWWRGRHPDGQAKKWRYAIWDNDATFDHYFNYTGIPSTAPDSPPCYIHDFSIGDDGHVAMLNALMENDEFYCMYVSRYHELADSYFNCENMIGILDSIVAVIEPEMPRQIERWQFDGTYEDWSANVQELRDYILIRCDTLTELLDACYEFSPATLTMNVTGAGAVLVNGMEVTSENSPYQLHACINQWVQLEVTTGVGCNLFEGWQVNEGDVEITDPLSTTLSFPLIGSIEMTAGFAASIGMATVFVDAEPSAGGSVLLNGNNLNNLPQLADVMIGTENTLMPIASDGYLFSHWMTTDATLLQDSTVAMSSFYSCDDAIVTAVFVLEIGVAESEHTMLRIYPNPATDEITFASKYLPVAYSFYSTTGQLVMQGVVTKSNQLLDISSLSDGIYTMLAGEEKLRLVVAR
ncbi:MAG: CotH kinase family protein [Flavobacteriales bacterium]